MLGTATSVDVSVLPKRQHVMARHAVGLRQPVHLPLQRLHGPNRAHEPGRDTPGHCPVHDGKTAAARTDSVLTEPRRADDDGVQRG